MSWQEIHRDEEVRRLAYHRGLADALDELPEDPEPASTLDPSFAGESASYRYMIVWNAYVEGRVDGGAGLPF